MNSLIVSCEKCLNVSATYQVKSVQEKIKIDGLDFTYLEKKAFCLTCEQELYVPIVEKENNENFQKIVLQIKKENRSKDSILNTIDAIMMKYKIGKKPLSLVLGWEEVVISNCYIDKTILSDADKSQLMTILNNASAYGCLLEKNKNRIDRFVYNKSKKALKKISNNKNGPIQKALQANRTELSNEDIKAYFVSEIDKGNN